ncbi:MAG: hypothetical protein AB8D52_11445 [Gammaproteobacteria bacterium]
MKLLAVELFLFLVAAGVLYIAIIVIRKLPKGSQRIFFVILSMLIITPSLTTVAVVHGAVIPYGLVLLFGM